MKDNLESYFKKQLNKDQPKQEDWNTLSDAVWDDAMSKLDQPKSDRKLIFLWSIVGVFTIVLGILFHMLTQLNNEVKAHTNATIIARANSKNGQEKIKFTKKDKKNIYLDLKNTLFEKRLKHKDKKSVNTKNNQEFSSHFSSTNTSTRKHFNASIKGNDAPNNNFELINLHQNISTPNLIKRNIPSPTAALPKISDRGISSNTSIILIDTFIYYNQNIANKVASSSKNSLYKFSAFYGLSLTATPMIGITDQSILKGYQKLQRSSSFGFDFGYYINSALQIRTGLSIINVKSWSYSNQQLEYNAANEYINNGVTYNNLELPMPTPVGDIETNLLFRKNSRNPIKDGDDYMAKFDVHQNYQLISLPLGLNYKMHLSHKHVFNFGAGLSWSKVLKTSDEFNVELINLADNSSLQLMSKNMKPHSFTKNNFLAYYAQIGYSYVLNDKLSIDINVHYFNNISKFSNIKNVNTNVHGITLKSGISIRF